MNNAFDKKRAHKTFVKQLEQADCGIAALRSILRYYGSDSSRQFLRHWSGSTTAGSNMLGLSQAAQQAGLRSEAYVGTVAQLAEADFPCILHVVSHQQLGHYWVAYGKQTNGQWLVGDPARGLMTVEDAVLHEHWKSGALLCLYPTTALIPSEKEIQIGFWSQVWQWAKPDWPALVVILTLGLLTAVLGLATSLCTQKLVDQWLPAQNNALLGQGIAALAWLLFLRVGLNFFRSRLLLKHNWGLNGRLMGHFFQGMLQMPLLFHQMRTKADWMQRMRDGQRIQQLVSLMVGQVGVDILALMASLALLTYYHWSIGLLGLLLSPLYYLITQWQQKKILQEQRNAMSNQAQQESFHLEALQQMESIQSGLATMTFAKRSEKYYGEWLLAIWKLGLSKLHTHAMLEVLGVFAVVSLLSICSYGILFHEWALGLLIGSLTAWGIASSASNRLGMLTFQIQESAIALERLAETMDVMEGDDGEEKQCARGNWRGLVLHQASLQLAGQAQPLLHIPNLSVIKGEIIGIVGPSGTGKTTLMQVLHGYRVVNAGTVTSLWQMADANTRFDIPVKDLDAAFWRKHIAYVPQKPQVFTGTVVENITLFDAQQSWKKVVAFCQNIGLHQMIASLPQGYFSMVGEGGMPLSEGQKQLLVLARALFQKPQLLFLDEPTASLDAQNASWVLNTLQRVKANMAIVIISHRSSDAEIADRVYSIENRQLRLVSKQLAT